MRRAAVTTQYPHIECVPGHRELLRRRDVEAVVVAVPTALHYQVARDALEAGKHVLCEKPLCIDVRQRPGSDRPGGRSVARVDDRTRLPVQSGHRDVEEPD